MNPDYRRLRHYVSTLGRKLNRASSQKVGGTFWRDASLVLLGGLLGAVPAFFNARMLSRTQAGQQTIERRAAALREYAAAFYLAFSTIGTILDREADKLEVAIKNNQFDDEDLETHLHNVGRGTPELMQLAAKVEADRVVLYALFGMPAPIHPFDSLSLYNKEDLRASGFYSKYEQARTPREKAHAALDYLGQAKDQLKQVWRREDAGIQKLAGLILEPPS